MQWMRMRPGSPEEMDLVDWRGRWIEEDGYDDHDDHEDDEDRQMEEFDPVCGFFIITFLLLCSNVYLG